MIKNVIERGIRKILTFITSYWFHLKFPGNYHWSPAPCNFEWTQVAPDDRDDTKFIASAAYNALLEIEEYSGRKHADGTLNTN